MVNAPLPLYCEPPSTVVGLVGRSWHNRQASGDGCCEALHRGSPEAALVAIRERNRG